MTSYLRTKYKMKNCTEEKLHDLDFRYDIGTDMYFTKFPVIVQNKEPVMFCELGVELDSGRVNLNVKKSNGTLYAPWYNEAVTHEKIINRINMNINRKFKEFDIRKIEKKKKYYKKG